MAEYAHSQQTLTAPDGTLCRVTSKHPPQQPWGRAIQDRREKLGWSIRHAARVAEISDAYWGQVERGYQVVKGESREIRPERPMLIQIAEGLGMSTRETNALLDMRGFRPLSNETSWSPKNEGVNLQGLTATDVRLLGQVADRMRAIYALSQPEAEEEVPAPTPLRRVASGAARKAAPERETAAEKRAREAAARNPHGRRAR